MTIQGEHWGLTIFDVQKETASFDDDKNVIHQIHNEPGLPF